MAKVEMNGRVLIGNIMEALDLVTLPDTCRYRSDQHVDLDCLEVEQDQIDDAATERDPEIIDPNLTDLRDGLDALRGGDIAMARILLDRAFDGHSAETRDAIEEALRPRAIRAAA